MAVLLELHQGNKANRYFAGDSSPYHFEQREWEGKGMWLLRLMIQQFG
jgi:hypothetical protein